MIIDKLKVTPNGSNFAKVVEVAETGVKLQIDGESSARETYYNSLVIPNVGDRVYIVNVNSTILVVGKLIY